MPTVRRILDGVRSVLGEHETLGGGVFTDELLAPHFEAAYRKLQVTLEKYGTPSPKGSTFFLLEPLATTWTPSQSGLSRFSHPVRVHQTPTPQWKSVVDADENGVFTFLEDHGASAGDRLYVYGVQGFTHGRYNREHVVMSTPSPNEVQVSIRDTGAYTSGGVALLSKSGPFWWDELEQARGPQVELGEYRWGSGVLEIYPHGDLRGLRIQYDSLPQGSLRPTDEVDIPNSEAFLIAYTAYQAARAVGADATAQMLLVEACGRDGESTDSGGHIGDMIQDVVRRSQGTGLRASGFQGRWTTVT